MYVVTLPASAARNASAYSVAAMKAGADILEVRGDITPGLRPFASSIPRMLSPRNGDLERLETAGAAYLDLDLNEAGFTVGASKLVISFHDYFSCPSREELLETAARARDRGAEIVKIAVTPREPSELLMLHHLQEELQWTGPCAILAMGPLAKANRLLSPFRNALTYTTVRKEDAAAPGQLAIGEHRQLEGVSPPDLYGIFGGLDLQTASPEIHDRLFKLQKRRARYAAFPGSDLKANFRALAEMGLRGCSITAPYKNAILPLLGEQDDDVVRCQAANTAVLQDDGSWKGYQTDTAGFLRGYPELRGLKKVTVVGSGGVVPAILLAGEKLGWAETRVCARNGEALDSLRRTFKIEGASLDTLGDSAVDAIIWTLPLDRGELKLPKPSSDEAIAVDLRYGQDTLFMRLADGAGFMAKDGTAMLMEQALAQNELFSKRKTTAADRSVLAELAEEMGAADGE
ncbi:MAG: type I 3-dehydroquinate dehydratase [Planctomycetota bacterium]